jgi:hypothetical protein
LKKKKTNLNFDIKTYNNNHKLDLRYGCGEITEIEEDLANLNQSSTSTMEKIISIDINLNMQNLSTSTRDS